MQRESRRNARIRDEDRREDDIPEDIPTARMEAHAKRRIQKQTKTRWVTLAGKFAKDISLQDPQMLENTRQMLRLAREAAANMKTHAKHRV